MNTVKIKNRLYRYESFWRSSANSATRDKLGKRFPWPTAVDNKSFPNWQHQIKDVFILRLEKVQDHLKKKGKYEAYKESKKCLICGQINVAKGMYQLNMVKWEDSLMHYVTVHDVKPSDEFVDKIMRYELDTRVTSKKVPRLTGRILQKKGKKYLKMDKNQIMIIDALMQHGSKKNYVDSGNDNDNNKNLFRYSEHAGLIDFHNSGLDKVVVSGNTTRVDEGDNEIFMPQNMPDMYDYEYIFHTHPATPKPGGRAVDGVLYEFPSISDMFHFLDHYNDGKTQGSLVLAAEGLYVIRKLKFDGKKIKIDEDRFLKDMRKVLNKVQLEAISKYGVRFSTETFFSKIAQNRVYLDEINKMLERYQLVIDLYTRTKSGSGRWIINDVFLPVYVVEHE